MKITKAQLKEIIREEVARMRTPLKEATFKQISQQLRTKLENMGYETRYDKYTGYYILDGTKELKNGAVLSVVVQPSEAELKMTNRGRDTDDFTTVDVSFAAWKPEVVKSFFGLKKTTVMNLAQLPDNKATKVDLGAGLFDIPVDQSLSKIIDLVKKAESKVNNLK